MHPKKPIGFSLDFGLGFEYFENLGISILKVSKTKLMPLGFFGRITLTINIFKKYEKSL